MDPFIAPKRKTYNEEKDESTQPLKKIKDGLKQISSWIGFDKNEIIKSFSLYELQNVSQEVYSKILDAKDSFDIGWGQFGLMSEILTDILNRKSNKKIFLIFEDSAWNLYGFLITSYTDGKYNTFQETIYQFIDYVVTKERYNLGEEFKLRIMNDFISVWDKEDVKQQLGEKLSYLLKETKNKFIEYFSSLFIDNTSEIYSLKGIPNVLTFWYYHLIYEIEEKDFSKKDFLHCSISSVFHYYKAQNTKNSILAHFKNVREKDDNILYSLGFEKPIIQLGLSKDYFYSVNIIEVDSVIRAKTINDINDLINNKNNFDIAATWASPITNRKYNILHVKIKEDALIDMIMNSVVSYCKKTRVQDGSSFAYERYQILALKIFKEYKNGTNFMNLLLVETNSELMGFCFYSFRDMFSWKYNDYLAITISSALSMYMNFSENDRSGSSAALLASMIETIQLNDFGLPRPWKDKEINENKEKWDASLSKAIKTIQSLEQQKKIIIKSGLKNINTYQEIASILLRSNISKNPFDTNNASVLIHLQCLDEKRGGDNVFNNVIRLLKEFVIAFKTDLSRKTGYLVIITDFIETAQLFEMIGFSPIWGIKLINQKVFTYVKRVEVSDITE